MENLDLHVNNVELKDELVCKNCTLVKKLVNWKDKNTGKESSYYAWVVKVRTKDNRDVYVKVSDTAGKLKTIDDLGVIEYNK